MSQVLLADLKPSEPLNTLTKPAPGYIYQLDGVLTNAEIAGW